MNDRCVLCNGEKETIEHLFIYCQKHLSAWVFVENLLKKYTGNRFFYLNDTSRILGCNMDEIALILLGRLHRVIWISRCNIISSENTDTLIDFNILDTYKRNLKGLILMEYKRLNEYDFESIYAKNQALCSVRENKVRFKF